MKRLILVLALLMLGAPGVSAGPQRFGLEPGEAVLWSGPRVDSSAGGEAFEYALQVAGGGERLRVALDHPEVGDTFAVDISGPGGAGTSFVVGPGIYSEERFFHQPKAGTWRIRVTARDVTESAFRMRAKLERVVPDPGTGKEPLLPNLQILPPHEASFLIPVTNGAGDGDPTGIDAAGQGGCHPEEHVEDQAVRCLRFAYGVRNTGLGPMDLSHRGQSPLEHELIQRIHRADGSFLERSAGRAVFHKTHGHWHHADAVNLQLFQVLDKVKGKLAPAGRERTKGFAHRNELLRDWEVFYPTLEVTGFGLRPGWADIYEWDRPGNYIDFGVNGDGLYVVRMKADPVDGVVESNERDNFGYTLLRVTGNRVEIIETGRGRDPWDRCKILVGPGGHPDPPRNTRPRNCPPDTT